MDRIKNPFAPGAGTQPPELAGRDELRDTVRIALQRIRRREVCKEHAAGRAARRRQDRPA